MAKTPPKVPIYYFDACVFLSLINKDPTWYQIVEGILEESEQQLCEVHTSQLSIAEVSFAEQEKKGKALSSAVEKRIDGLWHPSSPVRILDVHSIISFEAKSIIRTAMKDGWTKGEDWSVKPPDAIHLASAKFIGASYLFTYDKRLLKLKSVGIEILEPFLAQPRLPLESHD